MTQRIGDMLFPDSPPVMTGDINVAVADFRAVSVDNGAGVQSTATALAESLERELFNDLSIGVGADFDVQVRGPADVGMLSGDSADELVQDARDRAARLSASVLVDGHLTQSATGVELHLSLHLSPYLLPGAEELVGQYELGQVAQVAGDISSQPVLRKELRDALLRRVGALVELIAALGYYSQDRMDEAHRHLDLIAVRGDNALPDGGALLHVMRGNVALKSGRYDDAEVEYQRALDAKSGYARAYVGLAEAAFLQSVGNAECVDGQINEDGIHEAVDLYQRAQNAPVQPPLGDVSPKIHAGLGRSLWCLSRAGVVDRWKSAEAHFVNVISEFDNGNDRIREVAAESHAGLGLLRLTQPDGAAERAPEVYQSALASYEKAITTTKRPERQGLFTSMVAFIQGRLGHTASAMASYERAAELDPERSGYYLSERDKFRIVGNGE